MDEVQKWLDQYRNATHLDQEMEAVDNLATYISPKLHRFVSASCPRDAVDDVLQEALIGITKSLDGFKKNASVFKHWCFRIARNKLANHLETERRQETESLDVEEIWQKVEASTENSPLTAEARERLDEALEILMRVKPPCSHCLTKRFMYGFSNEELGQSLGKTPAAAGLQVRRCIELAKLLTSKKGAVHA